MGGGVVFSRCRSSPPLWGVSGTGTSPDAPRRRGVSAERGGGRRWRDEGDSPSKEGARMEAGGAFALQDELDRLRRRLDTADGDLGAPLPPPEDAPLEYEEIGGRDSAPTLSAADRESAAARLSRSASSNSRWSSRVIDRQAAISVPVRKHPIQWPETGSS